jgi:hypothetical protein
MSNQEDDREVITTIIYTVESKDSTKKAEADKSAVDPDREQVIAILQGGQEDGEQSEPPTA